MIKAGVERRRDARGYKIYTQTQNRTPTLDNQDSILRMRRCLLVGCKR